jgi:glycerol-3-phosphate acyltransferase PlsY
MIPVVVIILAACYMLGNINPAIIIGRLYGVDVTKEGSGNAGTTNAMRTIGKRAGVITFLIDAAKGFIPTFLLTFWISDAAGLFCGIFVILGHMWPVVFKFKGGKGVATTFGVLLAINPWLALIEIGIVIVLTAIFRIMSVAVLIACAAGVPLAYFVFRLGGECTVLFAIILVLIVVKHRANIKRIVRGEESKLTFGSKDKKQQN